MAKSEDRLEKILRGTNRFMPYDFVSADVGCQDSGEGHQRFSTSIQTEDYSIIIVAENDVNVSCLHDSKNCCMAADIFCDCLKDEDLQEQMNEVLYRAELEHLVEKILQKVIARWKEATEANVVDGITTFLAFVTGRKYCFAVQMGKGVCVTVNQWGQFEEPIRWGESVGSLRFWAAKFYEKEFPIAVFLGNDCIKDYFQNDEKLYDFYRKLLRHLADTESKQTITEFFAELPIYANISSALLLDYKKINDKKKRWEGDGRRIFVENYGDMDTRGPNDTYLHYNILPAKVGTYTIDVGIQGRSWVNILEVSDKEVRLSFRGEEYCVTKGIRGWHTMSETQNSYDGPWYNAEESTTFTLL